MNAYKTLAKSVCAEYLLKRSRFLCYTKPVSNEESAAAFVKEISAKHWDARHNVWAYTLREGQRARYSDGGEPQGTAGLPVLEALRSRGVTDAVVVVARYFGGILLGASGLTRAYAHSAGLGMEESGIMLMQPCVCLRLTLTYPQYAHFERILENLGGVAADTSFAENVTVTFDLPDAAQDKLLQALAEFAAGAKPEMLGSRFMQGGKQA
ncbi:MAG: IMPACT family protein [Oscillospiraceae bacterium]|jgi:uncharacterized YigZ family protein|nr:IMPACT family protein [Oscillospiraceae bacterium]